MINFGIFFLFFLFLIGTFNIQCSGRGVRPLLEFTTTKIEFKCTPNQEIIEESFFIKNISKYQQMYEFGTPTLEASGITISPKCSMIQSNETIRIEIVFDPSKLNNEITDQYPADDDKEYNEHVLKIEKEKQEKLKAEKEAAKKANEEENGEEAVKQEEEEKVEGEETPESNDDDATPVPVIELPSKSAGCVFKRSNKLGNEPGSLHASWNIPCFIKEINNGRIRSPRSARMASMKQPIQTLEISTTILLEKNLSCVVPPDTLSKLVKSTETRLDFGQMAVGQEDIAPLKLINLHADNVILKLLQSPNVQGPFSIVNALRPLEGNNENGDHMTVYIRFKPEDQLTYCEKVTFETEYGQASIVLVGQGVSPTLELTPSVSEHK